MRKILKNFVLCLSLMLFGNLLFNNTAAFAEISSDIELVKLEYTMDEIRKMSLGEYYTKIFPEIFEEFTLQQKQELFNTPYPSDNEIRFNKEVSSIPRNLILKSALNTIKVADFGFGYGSSTLTKVGTNRFYYSVTTNIKFQDGDKAKKIHHSSVLEDRNGTTWMIRTDSKTDTNYFNMNGYKDVSSGEYNLQTVHTVTAPSGYFPSTGSSISSSGMVSSN